MHIYDIFIANETYFERRGSMTVASTTTGSAVRWQWGDEVSSCTVLISCSNGSACVFFLTGRKPYKLQSSSTTVIDKMPSLAMTDMRTGSLCTTCVCALTCATLRLNPLYVLCDKKNPTFYWVSPYTTCRYSGWLRRAGIFRLCPRHFSSIKLYIRN